MNHPQQAREKDKSPNKEEKPKEIPNQGNSLLHDESLQQRKESGSTSTISPCCEEIWFMYDEKSAIRDWLTRCLLNSEKVFCVMWDSVTVNMDTRKLFHNHSSKFFEYYI